MAHRALPSFAQLRRAGQHLAEEGETLVDERPGEVIADVLEGVEGQVVLPGLQRLIAHQRRNAGDRPRLPDNEWVLPFEPGGGEESLPIQTRRAHLEIPSRPVIVSLEHVLRVGATGMDFGDSMLQRENPGGLRLAVGNAAERQHGRDVGFVFALDLVHPPRGANVIVAIGHAQSSLEEEGRIAAWIVQVLRNPQAKQIVGVELGRVEHVHVRTQRRAEKARELFRVGDCRDAMKRGLEWLEALRVDARLVHEAFEVVADLLGVRAGGSLGLSRLLEQIGDPSCGQLGQDRVSPPGAAIGGDFGALTPGSIGEGKEVVAGRDRAIHSRKVEAHKSGGATHALTHVVGSRSARGGHEHSDRPENGMVVVHPWQLALPGPVLSTHRFAVFLEHRANHPPGELDLPARFL